VEYSPFSGRRFILVFAGVELLVFDALHHMIVVADDRGC